MQQQNRQAHGSDELSVKLPDAGVIVQAQRAATENASRVASAALHYAISVNRAWLETWDGRLNDYLDLPKRFAEAQTEFLEHAYQHYQEGVQRLGGIATKVSQEAEIAVRESQEASGRAAEKFQSELKESGWGARPKESSGHGGQARGGEERREGGYQQPGSH
jgi:hypothetical protein